MNMWISFIRTCAYIWIFGIRLNCKEIDSISSFVVVITMYRYHLRFILLISRPPFVLRCLQSFSFFLFVSLLWWMCWHDGRQGSPMENLKKKSVVYKQAADWRYWTMCMIRTNMKWNFIDFIALLNRCYLWMESMCGWFMLRKICSFFLCILIECLYVPVFVLIIWFTELFSSFIFHHLGKKTRWKSGSNACWWFSIVKKSRMKSLIFRSRAKNRKRNICKNIRPTKAQRSAIKSPDMHYLHNYLQTPNIAVSTVELL